MTHVIQVAGACILCLFNLFLLALTFETDCLQIKSYVLARVCVCVCVGRVFVGVRMMQGCHTLKQNYMSIQKANFWV